jgi:acetyl-CoA acetyltransferase
MTTMLHALEDSGERFGLQSMCEAGGGQRHHHRAHLNGASCICKR